MALIEQPTPVDLDQLILILAEAADAQHTVFALMDPKGIGANRTALWRVPFRSLITVLCTAFSVGRSPTSA